MTPDFIIIGAMKCGTSTLAAQLGAQAGIFMTTPKEPNFFSDDAIYARGAEWYEELFAHAASGDLKGEASTHYTKLPDYPRVIARLTTAIGAGRKAPRLIYMIRDPLKRAMSHYIHEWTQSQIDCDVTTALKAHPELVSYGCYGQQLEPWIAAFGRENLLVLSLEHMQRAPQETLDRVAAFLGHTGGVVWQEKLERLNVSAERLRRIPFQRLLIDNGPASWLRRRLVPQAVRDRIKAGWQMRERPVFSLSEREQLEQTFAEDYLTLRRLIPDDPELDLSYPFIASPRS